MIFFLQQAGLFMCVGILERPVEFESSSFVTVCVRTSGETLDGCALATD
jgi:hypothetical protein